MMSSVHASGRRRRPGGRAVAATAFALGVAGAAGYLVAGTGAQASNAAPAITANPPEPPEPPEPPPPPPPTTRPPFQTLPTVPQATLVLDPGPAEAPTTTASPTTTTDTTEANTTTSTVATATEGSDANGPATPAQYSVTVTRAEVGCDGIVRVEYDTVAIPEPLLTANHLVVFNPSAAPADFDVVETTGNPANGSFTFEQPGQIAASYRLFVVAAFDPVNPAGPLAVDQVDVLPAPGC
jgi:hypothetical protein